MPGNEVENVAVTLHFTLHGLVTFYLHLNEDIFTKPDRVNDTEACISESD